MSEKREERRSRQTSFKDDMAQLKEAVERLESGQLGLEEGVEVYKKACTCFSRCQAKLASARNLLEDHGVTMDASSFLQHGEPTPADARMQGGNVPGSDMEVTF